MFIAADVIILVLVALCAFRGYRRGFILTLCSFLAVFVAFVGARYVSDHFAQPFGTLIQPAIEHRIVELFEAELGPAPETSQPDTPALPMLPPTDENTQEEEIRISLDAVLQALHDVPLLEGLLDSLERAVQDGSREVAANASKTVASYLAGELARLLLFWISFILIYVVWALISHTLDLAFRLPVLSTLNAMAGLCLGLLVGALLVFVAVWILKGTILSEEIISQTLLLRLFATANPLSLVRQIL